MNAKLSRTSSTLMLLTGILLVGFSTGRWSAPLAAWIGPALIVRFAREHKVWRGYFPVLGGYVVAFLIGFGAIWLT